MNFGNLGIALGAYTKQANEYEKDAEDKRRWDAQYALQKGADARANEQWGLQKVGLERANKQAADSDALMARARDLDAVSQQLKNVPDDKLPDFAQSFLTRYNDAPHWQDGRNGRMAVVDGKPVIVHGSLSRNDVQITPVTRESLNGVLSSSQQDLRRQLAMLSGEGFAQYADNQDRLGIERAKVDVQNRHMDVLRDHTADQARLTNEIIRTGNWGAAAMHRAQAAAAGAAYNGLGTPIGMSDDGTKMLMNNPKGGMSVVDVPPGFSGVFNKVSGAKAAPDISQRDRIALTAYEKALTKMSEDSPIPTGDAKRDQAAMGAFQARVEALPAMYGVEHLVGGKRTSSGVPVRDDPSGANAPDNSAAGIAYLRGLKPSEVSGRSAAGLPLTGGMPAVGAAEDYGYTGRDPRAAFGGALGPLYPVRRP